MDALAALKLQIAWGADEALDEAPCDRTRRASQPTPKPQPAATASPVQRASLAAKARQIAEAAYTIPALRDALASFTDCPLAVTATSLVFSDGQPSAGLVFVADVPGSEEDVSGIPMSGPAGHLLDRMLGSIGLDRTRLLITSLVPWRPPGNRPPTDGEIAMCLPFLLRHLALLQPRIVVTLGTLPAKQLTGSEHTIRKLRGRWQSLQLSGMESEVKLLPMLHPAALIQTPSWKKEAWADLLMLQQSLNSA